MLVALSSGANGLLCPMGGGKSERHRRLTEIINEVYGNLAEHRDAEGEYTSPEWKQAENEQTVNLVKFEFPDVFVRNYHELDHMRLYQHSASPASPHVIGHGAFVATWYWQCQGCHFVLPAQLVERFS